MFFCCCTNDSSGKTIEEVAPTPALDDASNGRRLSQQGRNSKIIGQEMPQELKAQFANEQKEVKYQCEPKQADNLEAIIAKAETGQAEETIIKSTNTISEFTVYLRRSSPQEPLGIAVTAEDEGNELVIKELSGKPASDWNSSYPDLRLLPGDKFVSVNGTSGPAQKLLQELQAKTLTFQMVMRRVVLIATSGVKKGALGFNVSADTMEVQHIFPGFLGDYNERMQPSKQIQVGDKLIEVNGRTGTNTELLAAMQNCKDGDHVSLSFSRLRPLFRSQNQGQGVK